MKITMLEPLGVSAERIEELAAGFLAAGHSFKAYDTVEHDVEKLKERSEDADVLIIANNPLPSEVIANAKNLKYISVAFVGIDHIGTDVCKERGIPISNAAGYCTDAVAELAVGLTIDCLRNVSACNTVIRSGGTKNGLVGFELAGKTVGIIGTGAIGCRAGEIFKAFGCKLVGYNRSDRPRAKELVIELMSLEEVLKVSDIVSIHTPLTPETTKLINRDKIALMKPGAILINTARGAVVDSEALAEALNEGRLGGAGIDVFEAEPPLAEDHPLLHAKNVVATPHVGFATKESIDRRAEITFNNVYQWFQGEIQNQML